MHGFFVFGRAVASIGRAAAMRRCPAALYRKIAEAITTQAITICSHTYIPLGLDRERAKIAQAMTTQAMTI